MEFTKINKDRAFYDVLDQIIDKIHKGELKPGDALPAERTMAEMMGTSRPVLREVLKALDLLGIVTSVQGGANYISKDLESCLIKPLSILFEMNNSSVRQGQELRSALEIKAASLAAQRITPLEAAELELILQQHLAAEDEEEIERLDVELDLKIASIAKNPMIYSVLAASVHLTEEAIHEIRDYMKKEGNSLITFDEAHKNMVQTIIDKDPEKAEEAMKAHLAITEHYMEVLGM